MLVDSAHLPDGTDFSSLAQALCRRHFGIGSDGLLVVSPDQDADLRMRMFNPDGTEDHCGNGLRCFVFHAHRTGRAPTGRIRVATLAGIRAAEVLESGPIAGSIRIEMGRAELSPELVPVALSTKDALGYPIPLGELILDGYSISTGTTHTVIFRDGADPRFAEISRQLETHPLFPSRTTVLWTTVSGPGSAWVRIWERGAGETLACGTGACAVAAVCRLTGRTGPRVAVTSAGGTLDVQVSDQLDLTLTGPATLVYEGTVPLPPNGICRLP